VEELLRGSATQMARAIRDREVSPVELVEAHIARAEKVNGEVNALVLPRFEQALEEAREAEAALDGSGGIGPLHGVPFTAKESIEVAGMPCTDGSLLLQGQVSAEDAVVIRNIRGAGAILLGKTNIPELAIHYDSNNLVYGATHNPHMHGRTAGGSSGGEGAAIATGMSPFGVGSDYGGSIRIPCHFCGVSGIRPGRWTVPYKGHSPSSHTMSVQLASEIGPMARFIEDLELLLPIFARPDPTSDPDVYGASFEPVSAAGLRVASFEEDGITPVSDECREAVRAAARALVDAGHEVVEERPPNQAEVRECFLTVALSEIGSVVWPILQPHADQLSPQLRYMLETKVEGEQLDLASYVGGLTQRVDLERAVAAWLEENPIAICPVAPTPAFEIGSTVIDVNGTPVDEVDLMTLCTYVNLMGLPAAAVPIKRSADGLPVGVQVIGRRGHEMEVLAVARQLEEAFGGWMDPEAVGQDVA